MDRINSETRAEVIDMLGAAIEKCKREIILIHNSRLPFKKKHEKIYNLRVTLAQSQRALLALLQDELNDMRGAA